MTELLHKDISNKWESIKTNLKRGWPYALASILVYYSLTLVSSSARDVDIYVLFLTGAFDSILSFLILGPIFLILFLLLTLILGSILRKMEKKEINKVIIAIMVTALGIFTTFVLSIVILFFIFTTGSIGFS